MAAGTLTHDDIRRAEFVGTAGDHGCAFCGEVVLDLFDGGRSVPVDGRTVELVFDPQVAPDGYWFGQEAKDLLIEEPLEAWDHPGWPQTNPVVRHLGSPVACEYWAVVYPSFRAAGGRVSVAMGEEGFEVFSSPSGAYLAVRWSDFERWAGVAAAHARYELEARGAVSKSSRPRFRPAGFLAPGDEWLFVR